MSNEIIQRSEQTRFSVAISTEKYQQLIASTLTDPARRSRFIANITSAVSVNKALQECTSPSIIAGALLGESLNLVPSPQLGQFYLVPFKNTVKRNGKVVYKTDANGEKLKDERGKWIPETISEAVFVLGYKGYIQLAIRSGYYRSINVVDVKRGEFEGFNPFTEEITAHWMTDPAARAMAETVGYAARFEYLNGFSKTLFWTKEQMMIHADTYSPAFNAADYIRLQNNEIPENELWRYSSFWYKNFDDMAKKTMLRQLISHWGAMNTEMQIVTATDNQVVKLTDDGNQLDLTPEAYETEAQLEASNAAQLAAAPQEAPAMEIPHEAPAEAEPPQPEQPQKKTRRISLGDL